MSTDSYKAIMDQKAGIMRSSIGIDYEKYTTGPLSFDYEAMLNDTGYDLDAIRDIQGRSAVGNTPLVELRNLTELVRTVSEPGKGARLFVKDEAANPSGSFKDRRASLSAFEAKKKGYKGIAAATSGNYGAAVASQAAKAGLGCIIVQEAFDSHGIAQPEIAEKTRACEAYGAEVVRLSVGTELFYYFRIILNETGYFNASLYTPYSILGIETLGYELAMQAKAREGRFPDVVMATHAGGGNVTGTARGLIKAGASDTLMVAASVDLAGLHMASDRDFNRKSVTTDHTGFSVPFSTWPDRADVPRNAARSLRYMDRFVTVTQGEVFYMTEALAAIEGVERGPAGMPRENIALSTVPPTAPPAPKLWLDLPYAIALRDLFEGYKFRAQQNTRYMEADMAEATITHVLDTLISTIISHNDIHRVNMRRLHDLAVERGIRDGLILIAGGTQVNDAMAVECGMDAGFGRGTKGKHVASFIVGKMMDRERGQTG